MGRTLSEKILARTSGQTDFKTGDIIWTNVDLAYCHDPWLKKGGRDKLDRLGGKIWDKDRVVVVADHWAPPGGPKEAELQQMTRDSVAAFGIDNFFDAVGISHQLVIEQGFARPGRLLVGGDSHSCTPGAVGCLSLPIGEADMLGVLATGQLWVLVPETVRIDWTGQLQPGVQSKDMVLKMLDTLRAGETLYRVIEYGGSTLSQLPMDARIVLTNMAVELSAKAGIIEADQAVVDYFAARGIDDVAPMASDPDASYAASYAFDAPDLVPLVACPHSFDEIVPAAEVSTDKIDQCFIGSCTGGRYEDLEIAARILKGQRVQSGTRLLVGAASNEVLEKASRTGVLTTLIEAGAIVTPSTCGPCAALHSGYLAAGERCITASSRNYRGRMGSPDAFIWTASAATVAATALTGRITDPREVLN